MDAAVGRRGLGHPVLLFCVLIAWPDPFFAFSLGTGKIVVASDRPIPSAGGERFLRDCERLLERSPLKAKSRRYRVYVTNESWRQRLFFLWDPKAWGLAYGLAGTAFLSGANFETGRVVHWGYVGTPPRTLAWLCAHELTHLITFEHLGLARFRMSSAQLWNLNRPIAPKARLIASPRDRPRQLDGAGPGANHLRAGDCNCSSDRCDAANDVVPGAGSISCAT